MDRHTRRQQLLALLRRPGPHRAADLARKMQVTERTIYRDMDRLRAAGLPVAGTRGQGYRVTSDVTLPPLNLTRSELEALHLGLEVIGDSAEPDLSEAAQTLSARIDAALAEGAGEAGFAFGYAPQAVPGALRGYPFMPVFRAALRARQMLDIRLTDGGRFHARPLALDFWGRIWTALIWDEAAACHRHLRLDTVEEMQPLPDLFVDEPGKRAADAPSRDT